MIISFFSTDVFLFSSVTCTVVFIKWNQSHKVHWQDYFVCLEIESLSSETVQPARRVTLASRSFQLYWSVPISYHLEPFSSLTCVLIIVYSGFTLLSQTIVYIPRARRFFVILWAAKCSHVMTSNMLAVFRWQPHRFVRLPSFLFFFYFTLDLKPSWRSRWRVWSASR